MAITAASGRERSRCGPVRRRTEQRGGGRVGVVCHSRHPVRSRCAGPGQRHRAEGRRKEKGREGRKKRKEKKKGKRK
jgi:hypothetical protein